MNTIAYQTIDGIEYLEETFSLSQGLRCWTRSHPFPDNYLALDVATSGPDLDSDLIVGIGLCVVRDRRIQERIHIGLDWTREIVHDCGRLQKRLTETTEELRQLRGTGVMGSYPLGYSQSTTSIEPKLALEMLSSILRNAVEHGEKIVGHNGWSFDLPMIQDHNAVLLGKTCPIPDELYVDTAMLFKAAQLGVPQGPDESIGHFWERMRWMRAPGVYWSMHGHCVPTFDLVQKAGLDPRNAYRADHDAHLAHALLEEFRILAA